MILGEKITVNLARTNKMSRIDVVFQNKTKFQGSFAIAGMILMPFVNDKPAPAYQRLVVVKTYGRIFGKWIRLDPLEKKSIILSTACMDKDKESPELDVQYIYTGDWADDRILVAIDRHVNAAMRVRNKTPEPGDFSWATLTRVQNEIWKQG